MKVWGQYIIFIFSLCYYASFSQGLNTLLEETNAIYKENKKVLYFPKNKTETNLFIQHSIADSTSIIYNQIELKKTEIKYYRQDLGLNFKASANYNLDAIVDEETNINTRSNIRTELEWNILKNGFATNRRKALVAQNEIFQLEYQKKEADAELWRRRFKRQYTYAINEDLKILLQQKHRFLNRYFDVIQQLYQQKYIGRDLLIQLGHQLHINTEKIKGLETHNRILQDSSLVVLKTKSLPLLQVSQVANSLDKKTGVEQDLALAKIKLQSHWTQDFGFSIYVNHNWTQQLIGNLNYASVGLRFSTPLRFAYRKKLLTKKQKLIKAQFQDRDNGNTNRWIVQYSQYQEKAKDLRQQFKNWEVVIEKQRISQILKKELSANELGITNLSYQLTQFEILENVLELKKQLYKVMADLKVIIPNIRYTPFEFKTEANNQTVILANESQYSYELQLSFIKAKGISKVYASNVTKNLKQLCKTHQIEMEENISENFKRVDTWINEELKSIKTYKQNKRDEKF